jgi:nucleoside-diphosphate-sugar epimerase
MAKILITGGSGFIGWHLAEHLYQLHDVTTIDIMPQTKPIKWHHETVDVTNYFDTLSNVTKFPSIYQSFEHYDVVIHLAAIPRVGLSLEFPYTVFQNNTQTTISVLEYCRLNKAKCIFVSSSSVQFSNVKENPYAMTKLIGEQITETYIESFGIDACIVRPFNVFGLGEADYGQHSTVLFSFMKQVEAGLDVYVDGTGEQLKGFTYVEDVCAGFELIVQELLDNDYKRFYDLGADRADTSVLTLASAIIEGTSSSICFRPARKNDPMKTLADKSKFPKNWKPKTDILTFIRDWKQSLINSYEMIFEETHSGSSNS